MSRLTKQKRWAAVLVLLLAGGLVLGQGFRRRGGGRYWDPNVKTARAWGNHVAETPTWTNAPSFERDVFVFARVRYENARRVRGGGWETDIPDSDLNLSYRLQQMTSMKVDPDGRIVNLTDSDLADYPFLYIVEPGNLRLSSEEEFALREYLENGGFLMFDDFWGEQAWANVAAVMGRVLPDRSFQELGLDHPIYSCLFKIADKYQLPNVQLGLESQYNGGVTWEQEDAREVHHRAIFDDKGRMMVVAFHNTDNGDGWEWEGYDNYYFRNFSEKIAYPLAINTLVYVMTH